MGLFLTLHLISQIGRESMGEIFRFSIYDTFFVTSEITVQGSCHQNCARIFFLFFLQIFSFLILFSVFLCTVTFFVMSLFVCMFGKLSRTFEKRQGQSRVSEIDFSNAFSAFENQYVFKD